VTAVVLLTAVALSPLLRTDQPCTHDGGLHYFRIVAMRHALDDGLAVSRWVPDLAFGYGYPFFNYRAAASYVLGLLLYLTGLSLPQALNAVYVVSLIAAAAGMYLLGRDLFGPKAGVVSAVAYVYAPYILIDALVRGNMPESVALALLPFILWSFRRLLLTGMIRYMFASVGSLAALWLSHNISSLLFTPFLVVYLLVVWLARRRRGHFIMVGVALALGVGLTAFFWVPAVLEQGDVQLHLSRTTRNNDYHFNFVDLSEVLASPEAVDTALLNPPLRIPLGFPLVIVAVLGTAYSLWRWRGTLASTVGGAEDDVVADPGELLRRERLFGVIFFAASGGAMVFMATRASLVVWDSLPLIPFVQFPWRFVGRAILPFSLLAGALVAAPISATTDAENQSRPTRLLSLLIVLTVVAFLVLGAFPFSYPPTGYCPAKPHPNILDVFAYERSTGLVGVDPEGSYFPTTVRSRPSGSPLEEQYAANLNISDRNDRRPIARFDLEGLPSNAIIHQAEYAPNRAQIEIETPMPIQVRFFTFAFPGWRVQIDGREVEIVPSEPEGLITFQVPAGRHVVVVEWAATLVRSVATMVSVIALGAVILIGYSATRDRLSRKIRSGASVPFTEVVEAERPALSGAMDRPGISDARSVETRPAPAWALVVALMLLALMLLAFKVLVVDRYATLFRQPGVGASGTLNEVDYPLDVVFADGVRLLGFEQSTTTLPADGTLHLALYWSAYSPPSRDYRSTVALVDQDGRMWSPKTAFPRRGFADMPPSPAWGNGRYAVEGFDIEPLPGTPPGQYDLLLTAFDRETLLPLNVLDQSGQVMGPNLTIGQIQLARPWGGVGEGEAAMGRELGVEVGPLRLEGVSLDRTEAGPGDAMGVTLFWRVLQGTEEGMADLGVHLALVRGEEEVKGWELPPVREDWPTTEWEAGDFWRGQHILRLPGGLESGEYSWELSVYERGEAARRLDGSPVELGELQVKAPEREWEAPAMQIELGEELGGKVRLLGAEVEPRGVAEGIEAGETLTVTLVWQGKEEMEQSYRVYVHVLGPTGEVLVQSDGEPAGWRRPTTGWAVGEVVKDERVLSIPRDAAGGAYEIVTGMYDLGTGERLPLSDGSTSVLVTPLIIKQP